MKKIFIFIITLLSITNIANASFWSVSSLDLYKNIDNWIEWLQDNMISYELEWWNAKTWILKWINKLAKNNNTLECLDQSKYLSKSKFDSIIQNKNGIQISEIIKLFNNNCQTNWNTTIELANKYADFFILYNDINTNTAKEKTEQIYKLSQIWLYSDWNLDNSWFDLITDIEEIDKIIFANVVDYEWEEIDSIDDTLNDYFDPLNKKIDNLLKRSDLTNNNGGNDAIQYSPTEQITSPEKIINTSNEYVCANNQQSSWLSENSLNWLLNNINNDLKWNNKDNPWIDNNKPNSKFNNNNNDNNNDNNWNYQKVVDNSLWPCESFFCIVIDFVTYEHSLFWWWEDITIEYLLNRSNKHLSKFAATSLIPAKMWTNNFELWLKDLNLPDVFHLSFQISTKPIPILNIEKKWTKDNSEFSAKNMLEEYYKVNGLNYNRRNDLDALVALEANKQNINNAAWLTIEELLKKQSENDTIARKRQQKVLTLQKSIEAKVSYWTIWTFEEQYTELDKFTVWIVNYVNILDSLIENLRQIPVEY